MGATAIVAFLIALVISAVVTPTVRKLAVRYGLFDQVRSVRKIHGTPIPRLGGIAIVVGFFAPLIALLFYQTSIGRVVYQNSAQAAGLLLAGAVIAALGLFDDLRGCGAPTKLIVQVAVAMALYVVGYRIGKVSTPFGSAVELGALGLPVTIVWIVGIINAVNLIDGLDGLAGGIGVLVTGTVLVVALRRPEPLMVFFSAALTGAIIGFLFYNFNPATIFMGDTGSMFIGLMLATTSLRASQKSSTAVAILIPIVALGVPIGDTLLAIFRRTLRGTSPFHADKQHIHHRMLASGLSHKQSVIALYGMCAVLCIGAWGLAIANGDEATRILVSLALFIVAVLARLGYFRRDAIRRMLRERAELRQLQRDTHTAIKRLSGARSVDDVWAALQDFGRCLRSDALEMMVQSQVLRASDPSPNGSSTPAAVVRAKRTLVDGHDGIATIELIWYQQTIELHPHHELAVDVVCRETTRALLRIDRSERHRGAASPGDMPRVKRRRRANQRRSSDVVEG